MKKRVVVLISLALMLAMGAQMTAFAESDSMSVYKGVKTLLFDTTNVSVSAEIEFKYDGELFKTFRGEYKQDDINSFLRIMLDTPKPDGSVYTGGYTVVGNGSNVYSNDTYDGNYYVAHSGSIENTLLQSYPALSSPLDLIEAGLRAIAPQLDKFIVKQETENGGVYTVKAEAAPEFFNTAITYIAKRYAEQNYGYLAYTENNYCRSEFEDFNAMFAIYYEEIYGEKMPEDFITNNDYSDEADWARYSEVLDFMYAKINEESEKYSGGVLQQKTDGSYKWFSTDAEYMRAVDLDYLYYDDFTATLSAYYEKKFGSPLTEDDIFIITNSSNEELWNAYNNLTCEMDEEYRLLAKQNHDTVAIIVKEDGTYTEYNKDPYGFNEKEHTVTEKIMTTFKKLEIGSIDMAVEEDEQGNITLAKGTVAFKLTDTENVSHSFDISFECKAFDYGETEVKEFDPADYGFVTYDEYLIEHGEQPEEEFDLDKYIAQLKNVPETVEFAGATYETLVYIYEE